MKANGVKTRREFLIDAHVSLIMSSTHESPRSGSVRLFVGNLVPSITDVALLRLFSRFGDISNLQRNTEEGFAHLSVSPKGDKLSDIEHAVKSLNRTKWCGTTLRVECAREHYLDRLKREWAEERKDDCTDTDSDNEQPSAEHFANFKKGKHTTFSFPDVEFPESVLGNENDHETEIIKVENPWNEDAAVSSEPETDIETVTVNAPKRPTPVKSARLDSTLALFGLSSDTAERPPSATPGVSDNKRDRPAREQSSAKRPRSSSKRSDENSNEANDDPSVVDIDAEKDTARMILQKLYPESQATPDVASCRRLGLYRKLLQTPYDGANREKTLDTQADISMIDREISRRRKSEPGDAVSDKFRRAGLYKKLLT